MPGDPTTLESLWRGATGAAITDDLVDWPPDVFALTEVALERTEAYRFAVSPPAGERWPPAAMPDWASAVVAAGAAWTASAGDGTGPPPALVADSWAVLLEATRTPLDVVATGDDWRLCAALLTLHAIADEACAGMGVSVDCTGRPGCAVRGRGRELLARTGSLARVGLPELRVLPKVRTPAGGISLRSIARYACVRRSSVEAVWHKAPAQRPGLDPRRQPANIVLLPWPLRVRDSDFRPHQASVQRTEREPFGFFEFAPAETFDLDRVDRVLAAARDEVDAVDIVVLPESSVPDDAIAGLEAVLDRHGVGVLVAGIRDTSAQPGRLPGNWVHLGVRLGGRWWRYRQNKHHRWSLDEAQVLQYHLGGALHPGLRWWETMEVPRRSIQFLELGGGITVVAVICEDLARLDAVADLLRTIGPTLVLTVLLDGPQLASRWTARYASVLADDPGSAVLTLTPLGMVERSRPPGLPPSRVVALWKDPTRGVHEIALDAGAEAILLSTCADTATRHSADGRFPADDTTQLRDVGVHQLRAAAAVASPDAAAATDGTRIDGAPDLAELDLSVLAAWSQALAEAGADEERDAVIADMASAAPWRPRLGLAPPSSRLSSALESLADAARQGPGAAPAAEPLVRLVGQLLDAARDASDRGGAAARR
jgi:hypothetical protein